MGQKLLTWYTLTSIEGLIISFPKRGVYRDQIAYIILLKYKNN